MVQQQCRMSTSSGGGGGSGSGGGGGSSSKSGDVCRTEPSQPQWLQRLGGAALHHVRELLPPPPQSRDAMEVRTAAAAAADVGAVAVHHRHTPPSSSSSRHRRHHHHHHHRRGPPPLRAVVLCVFGMAVVSSFGGAPWFAWTTTTTTTMMIPAADAFSVGAGRCPRGEAAVGGSHLSSGSDDTTVIRQGTLAEGGFQVTIGDVVLSAFGNTTSNTTTLNTTTAIPEFLIDTTYEISVVGTRYTYKGCLIRLESLSQKQDLYAALLPGTNMGPAFACFGSTLNTTNTNTTNANTNTNTTTTTTSAFHTVTGISHTDNPMKTLHNGVLRLADPGEMALDITVVGLNNKTASLYAYSEFRIRFVTSLGGGGGVGNVEGVVASSSPSSPTNAPVPAPAAVPQPSSRWNETETDTVINNNTETTAPAAGPTAVIETAPTVLPPGTFQVPSLPQTLLVETLQLVLPVDDDIIAKNDMSIATGTMDDTGNTNGPNGTTTTTTSTVTNVTEATNDTNSTSAFVTEWTSRQLEIWITVTQEWFDDFYNRGFSAEELNAMSPLTDANDETTKNANNDSNNNTITRRRAERQMQTLSDNYGVVPGSMRSTLLNVTIASFLDDSTTSNGTMTFIYHQQLDYRMFNASRLEKPFGPLQYSTLPFRSRKARLVYARRLADTLPDWFASLSPDALAVPLLLGPLTNGVDAASSASSSSTKNDDSDDGWSGGAIAGIVVACLVVALGAAALLLVYTQRQDTRPHDPVASLIPDFERDTFSFGPDGTGGATDLEASSDEVKETAKNNGKVASQSPNEYVVYAPSGRLGIVLDSPDDGGPVVYIIKENSPMMEAIELGDRLIAVDEVDVRHMTPTRVSKLISKRSGNPMRKLTLIRSKPPMNEEVTIVFAKDGADDTSGQSSSKATK